MAIEKTTKYKIFYKYKSTDSGLTWTKVEPEEAEYVAWNTNSIDCGYIPPIKQDTTGGTTGDTGTTTGRCDTVVTYKDGTTSAYTINGEIMSGSIDNITAVTSVDIGTCATRIGNSAFEGCTYLTSVTIPNSVTSIGDYAFKNCYSLSSLEIPESITSIGVGAFEGCSS